MALEEPFFMKKLIYSLALCGSLTVVPTISEAALGDATLHPGTSNSDVKELQQKLSVIVKQHKPRDHIRFRLTQKLKVEIIAKRFMMADFVPFVKFFDLDFEK